MLALSRSLTALHCCSNKTTSLLAAFLRERHLRIFPIGVAVPTVNPQRASVTRRMLFMSRSFSFAPPPQTRTLHVMIYVSSHPGRRLVAQRALAATRHQQREAQQQRNARKFRSGGGGSQQ